jgi:hypothetical protein
VKHFPPTQIGEGNPAWRSADRGRPGAPGRRASGSSGLPCSRPAGKRQPRRAEPCRNSRASIVLYQQKKAQQEVSPAAVFGLSLFVVFLILAAQYENWALPAVFRRPAQYADRGFRRLFGAMDAVSFRSRMPSKRRSSMSNGSVAAKAASPACFIFRHHSALPPRLRVSALRSRSLP